MSKVTGKEVNRRFRKTFSRSIQRRFVAEVPELLLHVTAGLVIAGGYDSKEGEKISRDPTGEGQGKRQLRDSCQTALNQVGADHALSVHLEAILRLLPDNPE